MRTCCLVVGLMGLVPAISRGDSISYPIEGLFRVAYTGPRTVSIPKLPTNVGVPVAATISYSPEFSGTVAGTAEGPPNWPNGWVVEFSGTIRLTGTGFGTIDFGHFETRSGVVYQHGTPIFQAFGPQALGPGSVTFTNGLSAYSGSGNVNASLSWPVFTGYIFFSNGGTQGPVTRDLGAVGGTITYEYIPACAGDLNDDGVVDQSDLGTLLTNFGTQEGATREQGDLDGDGDVDQSDLGALVAMYGADC